MIDTCYLHIGCEKTGSTTLQTFLGENRSRLAERGVLFAQSPGGNRHKLLCEAVREDGRLERRREKKSRAAPASVDAFRLQVAEALREEASGPGLRSLILSEETMFATLQPSEIARLKAMLDPLRARFVVVVYLRRQDELVLSKYNTGVLAGREEPFAFPVQAAALDYAAGMERWGAVFGEDALRPRRFGEPYFVAGDLFEDFGATFALDLKGLDRTRTRNVSLDRQRLEFLRLINVVAKGEETPRRRWASRLQATASGPKLGAARAERLAFLEHFEASNREVARRYFGAPDALFTHPVGDDAAGQGDELTVESAAEIAFQAFAVQEPRREARRNTGRKPATDED